MKTGKIGLYGYGENAAAYTQFLASRAADNRESRQEMKRALGLAVERLLTQRQRQIVEMYYFEGLSMGKIAQECGINKSTVSRHLERSRNKIERSVDCFFKLR